MKNSKEIINSYLEKADWRVKENSSTAYCFGAMQKHIISEVSKDFWLRNVYGENSEIAKSYVNGDIHIHDLGGLSLYCCGYSLKSIILEGVHGVPNIPSSKQAKHFGSIINQIANLTTIYQNEIMGAVAFNSVDTLLAPFVKKDQLTYKQLKQEMQNLVFSINSNSRSGAEPAFSNMTFDLTPSESMCKEYPIISDEVMEFTYKDCQPEMDMINRAFCEIMLEGDGKRRPFSYPIPTYNIHKRFDWDNPNSDLIFEMAGKYGYPYFANFINSDMEVDDARSMALLPSEKLVYRKNGIVSLEKIKDLYDSWNISGKKPEYEILMNGQFVKCNEMFKIDYSKYENKFIKVKLENGYEQRFSKDHKCAVLENGKISIKTSQDLQLGDKFLLGAKEWESNSSETFGEGSLTGAAIASSLNDFEDFWNKSDSFRKGLLSEIIESKRKIGEKAESAFVIDTNKDENLAENLIILGSSIGRIFNYNKEDGTLTLATEKYEIINESYFVVPVKEIEEVEEENLDFVYNFEVDTDEHLFELPNGIISHQCCRLRLDLTELRKRNGGLFGSGDATGSIGVVTVNLPRIGYNNKNDKEGFFKQLDKVLEISKDSLEIKRKWLQENILEKHLIPAFETYVGTMNNHFSTIGILGMNEMCENFMGKNILDLEAKKFALEVGKHVREKLIQFQQETGNLYNYEATPAESTCYRLAKSDKEKYPDIITQGDSIKNCYYTNSCHIPVKLVEGIDQIFKHQDELQAQFTGGTVVHLYESGSITPEQAKSIVKSCFENYRLPYLSISPLTRFCPEHGFIKEHTDKCPTCGKELDMYQRVTGYIRLVKNFNNGKTQEFNDRKQLSTE